MFNLDGKKQTFEAGGPSWRNLFETPKFHQDLDPENM